MASYFELPVESNAAAAVNMPKEEHEELRGTSLLSPQVSRILDDLQLYDKSSSSDGDEENNSSSSEDGEGPRLSDSNTKIDDSIAQQSRQDPSSTANIAHGSKNSAKPSLKYVKVSSGPTAVDRSLKNARGHMTRFQSLRSTLFQAHIEDNMKKCHQEAQAREEAAISWKAQHEKRQGYSRPHTPEEVTHEKYGLGHRIGKKIRRLTSKESQTRASLEKTNTNLVRRESTATDDENEAHGDPWKQRQSYESSINHSDVDEIVRWVSRQDPPSDGERRVSVDKAPKKELKKEDSGHESLGHSDIEDLVRYASRKSISKEPVVAVHSGYSDESTASDSGQSQQDDDQDEDSLSRWVSRRDGAMAGPIRQQQSSLQLEPDTEHDSDVPEIGRWRTHHDSTSGESIAGSEVAKKDDVSVIEAKRGRSRERSPRFDEKGVLKDDDVDKLVRWVSRRHSRQQSNPDVNNEVTELKHHVEEKKQQIGMTVDEGSLDQEDLEELLAHVRGRQTTGQSSGILPTDV